MFLSELCDSFENCLLENNVLRSFMLLENIRSFKHIFTLPFINNITTYLEITIK